MTQDEVTSQNTNAQPAQKMAGSGGKVRISFALARYLAAAPLQPRGHR